MLLIGHCRLVTHGALCVWRLLGCARLGFTRCAVMRYMSTCMCDMRFMKYMRYRVLRESHRAAMMA